VTTVQAADRAPAGAGDATFRPDIEGLRGIAVLLVVLFHAGLPVSGGFVGVDVFFVISGFLITGLLLREHSRSGRVSYARFYARRVRRILPAAAAVLIVTLAAAYALVGPLDRPEVMADGASAALSVANVRFALAAGDYFTTITQPSPFLHFWSLAVEEQFYLVWPAVLFLIARGGRRSVPLMLLAVLAASFAANVWLTASATNWAFYSLPGRAWQLAAGGLLALAAGSLERIPRIVLALAGWLAAAGLVASALLLSASLPYPGLLAVAPTACAAILIATGVGAWGPRVLLATPPVRFVGRISYSLYLWHWPILILPAIALGMPLVLAPRLALAGASVVVAWASWRFIEEPFRRGRLALARPRLVLPAGVAAIVAVVVLAGALNIGSIRAIEDIGLAAGGETPSPTIPSSTPGPAPTIRPGASATSPAVVVTPEPTPSPEPTLAPLTWDQIPDLQLADPFPLPRDVQPSLLTARRDNESVWRDRCGAQVDVIKPPICVYGDPNGSITVALVGDSHAAQWFPAFEAVAIANHWRLVPYLKLSCPFIDIPLQNWPLAREYTECAAWRDEVIRIMPEQHPDIVVVGMSHRGIFPWLDADKNVTRQGRAIGRAIAGLPGQVLVMIDTARTNTDVPGCLAEHPADIRPCALPRAAFEDSFGVREAIAAEAAGAGTLDLISSICPAIPCQVVRNGMIVYRDNHHLTATFSAALAPDLDAALRPYVEALALGSSSP
jgi:peptidoglycan/LPS O-acetylase OafA/YrhL